MKNNQIAKKIRRIGKLKTAVLSVGFIFASSLLYGSEQQPARESVTFSFHFRVGDDLLMQDYKENSRSLDQLQKLIREVDCANIASIRIIGSSSPEGSSETNETLALKRAKAVRGYIVWQFPQVQQTLINLSVNSDSCPDWLRAVEADPDVPRRDRVLEILRSSASLQTKWANIRMLVGNPADYMERTIFPRLRNAVSCVVVMKAQPAEPQQEHSVITPIVESVNTITEQTANSSVKPIWEPVSELNVEQQAEQQVSPIMNFRHKPDPKRAVIAIKTNLLFDLASAVNLEVEIPIGKRWSIAAGAVFPQWNLDNRYCVTMTEVSLEPRLWLGDREHLSSGKPRNSLTGHFIGVYGNYLDNYDLQWKHEGVMGSGYGAGITYGYSHRLGRSFNMEYSIGVGALYLKNKSFRADGDYKYLELTNSSQRWKFLPTRAKISLVWLIGNKGVNRK